MTHPEKPELDVILNIEDHISKPATKELIDLIVMTANDNGLKECLAVTPDSVIFALKEIIAESAQENIDKPVTYTILTKEDALSKNVMSVNLRGVTLHFVRSTKFFNV